MWQSHLASVLAMVVLLFTTVSCQQGEAPVQELKAGVGVALSGASATLGIMLGRTYEMAAEDIGVFEVAGKKYKWTVIEEDNLYASAGGVQEVYK